MKTLYRILNKALNDTTQARASQCSDNQCSDNQCNYDNNYYGDQVCTQQL